MEDKAKYTLITNIEFINVQHPISLRLECHSLLLQEGVIGMFASDKPTSRLRGFSVHNSMEIFCHHFDAEQITYELISAASPNMIVMGEQGDHPLFSGSLMNIGDLQLFLQASDITQPLDVHKQEGDILEIWKILRRKCVEYWQAPYMPFPAYGPPVEVLNAYAREEAAETLATAISARRKRQ